MTMEKQIYHSDSDFTFYEKYSGKKRNTWEAMIIWGCESRSRRQINTP